MSKARRRNQVLSEPLLTEALAGLNMLNEGQQKKKRKREIDEQRRRGPGGRLGIGMLHVT